MIGVLLMFIAVVPLASSIRKTHEGIFQSIIL